MEKIFQKVKKLANGDENFFRVFPMIFFVIWPNDNKMPIYVVGKKYGTTILKYCSQAHRNCALRLIFILVLGYDIRITNCIAHQVLLTTW